MSTQTPTIAATAAAEFTRAELIILMCVTNARAVDVRAAAGENYQQWQQAEAGSTGMKPTQPKHAHLLDLPAYATLGDKFVVTHEVTRHRFRVEVKQDCCSRAPELENDGHGLTIDSDWRIEDYDDEDLLYKLGFDSDDTSPEAMEQHVRYRMMRPLSDDRWHYKYYDVWETLKIARKDGWCGAKTDDELQAAVDRDYEYLRGWYADEWFWGVLHVVLLDENDEDTEHEDYLGGVEIAGDMNDYLKECIADMVADVHRMHHAATHKGQLELNI